MEHLLNIIFSGIIMLILIVVFIQRKYYRKIIIARERELLKFMRTQHRLIKQSEGKPTTESNNFMHHALSFENK
jgi:hypothetical protein